MGEYGPYILVAVFVAATIIGYFLIKNVPSLLHTPLMSGMNALSGVTVLGALVCTGVAAAGSGAGSIVSEIFGFLAIVLAMINVVAGFAVTHRMLKMFHK